MFTKTSPSEIETTVKSFLYRQVKTHKFLSSELGMSFTPPDKENGTHRLTIFRKNQYPTEEEDRKTLAAIKSTVPHGKILTNLTMQPEQFSYVGDPSSRKTWRGYTIFTWQYGIQLKLF